MQTKIRQFEEQRRAGFQMWKEKLKQQAPERFWKRVDRKGFDDCWVFLGSRSKKGYGRVSHFGKMYNSSQLAWIFTNGEYDTSLDVCHQCDNPPCCNPNHLFLGTAGDNMKDMYAKGRHIKVDNRGEKSGTAILTERMVLDIRERHARGETQRQTARVFGVNYRTINMVVLRKTWAHI